MAQTIRKLEQEPMTGFGVGLAAALFALFLFALMQWLGPLLVRWVGGLLG